MHPVELFWLMDAKKPEKMYGSMTEKQVAETYDRAYGLPAWQKRNKRK